MREPFQNSENILSDGSFAYVADGSKRTPDIDHSLLEDSLLLTPWQRLIENDRSLALVRMLEQAKIRDDGAA